MKKILIIKDIVLDLNNHTTTISEKPVHLTQTEFAILKILMTNPQQAVSKSTILDKISMDTPDCTDCSLKMHISNIRLKLKQNSSRDYIETIWGIGFKMN